MTMRRAAPLLALTLLTGSVSADIVLLKDGRVFDGKPMERTEDGILVKFANGEVLIPDELIQDAVLANDTAELTAEEQEKADKGLVRYEGRWVRASRRDELIQERIEERRKEIEAIREHTRWVDRLRGESRFFTFEFTVPPHIYEYYRDMMEAYFIDFAKTWKVKPPKKQPKLPIMFYTDREAFNQISGAGGGALAYFRFVVPREIDFYYDRLDPVTTEHVMYHEVNHYLQMLLNEKFSMPHFPGEALAEYYGASRYDTDKGKLEVGLVQEGRLVEIKNDILADESLGLEKMITTDQLYEHYTWGWSLAHFCLENRKYRKRFEQYVQTLANGKNVERVMAIAGLSTVEGPENWRIFRECMGLRKPKDVEKLEAAWHDYVKNELQVVSAGGLEKAARDAERTGRPIRARRLYSEAIEKGTTSALTYHRYARLLDRKGEEDEAIEMWRKAVELEPLEATYHAALGKALIDAGQKEEGERCVALAREIDPDNPYLEGELTILFD
jgi:tetratricopeptide (TPR) repeat protein